MLDMTSKWNLLAVGSQWADSSVGQVKEMARGMGEKQDC